MTSHEKSVAFLFVCAVALFFMREPGFITGWADLLPAVLVLKDSLSKDDGVLLKRFVIIIFFSKIKDATPAMFIVIVLFMIPANWRCFKFFRGNSGM